MEGCQRCDIGFKDKGLVVVAYPKGSKYPIIIYLPKTYTRLLLPKSQVPKDWVLGPLGLGIGFRDKG